MQEKCLKFMVIRLISFTLKNNLKRKCKLTAFLGGCIVVQYDAKANISNVCKFVFRPCFASKSIFMFLFKFVGGSNSWQIHVSLALLKYWGAMSCKQDNGSSFKLIWCIWIDLRSPASTIAMDFSRNFAEMILHKYCTHFQYRWHCNGYVINN